MEPLTLGIAGLGTVGGGLLGLLQANGPHFANIVGREIRVTGISARDRKKERGIAVDGVEWFDDPGRPWPSIRRMPSSSELIGGEDGPAKAAVEAALGAKKHVVTANKALLAKHGIELARLDGKEWRLP